MQRDDRAVRLSIDLRIQHLYAEHLRRAVETYGAAAAAGLALDVTNGEVLALVSLPDFDPNDHAGEWSQDDAESSASGRPPRFQGRVAE